MAWPEFIGENELDYCWVQNNDFKYSDLGQIKHFILYVELEVVDLSILFPVQMLISVQKLYIFTLLC